MRTVLFDTGDLTGVYGSINETTEDKPGYAGKVLAARLSGDAVDGTGSLTVYERRDGQAIPLFTVTGPEVGLFPFVRPAKSSSGGGDITDQYVEGIPIFGGSLYLQINNGAIGTYRVRLLIDDK